MHTDVPAMFLFLLLLTATVVAKEEAEKQTHVWKGQLAEALKNADRLLVISGAPAAKGAAPLWQIRGRRHIEGFLGALEIDDRRSGPVDGCNGDPHLVFFAGETQIAVVSWHHGKRIRWRGGAWRGDASLTAASQRELPDWFAQNGFRQLQLAREKDLARARAREQQARAFASFFPNPARQVLLESPSLTASEFAEYDRAAGKKLAAAMDDPVALTIACCQALGVSTTTWTSTGGRERRVLSAVDDVSGRDFQQALQLLQEQDEERRGLLGAARLFFRERFAERLDVKQRAKWSVILATAVVKHDKPSSQPSLLRYLKQMGGNDQATRDFLYDVALGNLGPEVHASHRQEPDLQPGAVLVLAQLGDARAELLARQQLKTAHAPQNVAALEVSLALTGDHAFLKAGHFELESYSIGYGALDAIERFKGAYGMELLVAGRHPWARVRKDILARFERITGAQVVGDGKSRLAGQRRMEAWWAEHGEQFTRERRAQAGE